MSKHVRRSSTTQVAKASQRTRRTSPRPRRYARAVRKARKQAAGQRDTKHLRIVRRERIEHQAEPTIAAPDSRPETEERLSWERLATQDRMFLDLEASNIHMHIAATLVFGPGTSGKSNGSADAQRIARHVATRLPSIPRYRQRVVRTPLRRDLLWIDDDRFDLSFHVRPTTLPCPGDNEVLKRMSGCIVSQKLDRRRPLWEMHVIDGLPDGRFAIVNKTHHCMADGMAGVELLAALLSQHPAPVVHGAAGWSPRPAPGTLDLLREDLRYTAKRPLESARWLGRLAVEPSRLRRAWGAYATPLWEVTRAVARRAPECPLNTTIGPRRRFDWMAVALDDVKAIKNRLGGTVNDVVLATVSGALRRFLERRDPDIQLVDLRALVPVNIRGAGEASPDGNHVSAWLVPLPVQEADPGRCLSRVRAVSAELKRSNQARAGEVLSVTGSTLLSAGLGLLNHVRPFNVLITNIPGPQMPLFLLDAPLEEVYPLVPLFPNQALGIALFSYNGKLFWGFNAEVHLVPDLDHFTDTIRESFSDLLAAAGEKDATSSYPRLSGVAAR